MHPDEEGGQEAGLRTAAVSDDIDDLMDEIKSLPPIERACCHKANPCWDCPLAVPQTEA